jgi:hypothetical protein
MWMADFGELYHSLYLHSLHYLTFIRSIYRTFEAKLFALIETAAEGQAFIRVIHMIYPRFK